ncbi:MAG: O-antigen ligase family protein, partial [Rubrivivax sp.]
QASEHTFGGHQRLAEGDISGSRFRIWADALQLIAAHPWTGVGWGNFNFAWSLTPSPNRHTAFFDHTHNLPLQLAVELGVPLALLICGLLLWALWQAWRRALAAEPAASAAGRCALMMVVLIGLHSLLEYPLWYAYFLLPTAFVWGFALGLPPASAGSSAGEPRSARPPDGRSMPSVSAGGSDLNLQAEAQQATPLSKPRNQDQETQVRVRATQPARASSWPLAAAGALCVLGAVFSVFDYLRVADIFAARPGAPPLEQRIEAGKRSVFFAHHAHYAAATVSDTPGQEMASFDIASHHLLDTRLMMAWAKGFAEVGDLDRARHLAERLREFRNPASADFFAECDKARSEGLAPSAWPFQCTPPSRALTWQDFLPTRRGAQSAQEGR